MERAAPPLSGHFTIRSDFDDFLGARVLDDVHSLLRHDGSFDERLVLTSGGRNVVIPSGRTNGVFNAVQISGGAFIDLGVSSNSEGEIPGLIPIVTDELVIEAPAQSDDLYEHTYNIVEQGRLVHVTDTSPKGSYNAKIAERKRSFTVAAESIPSSVLVVPKYLGSFVFDNLPDGEGGNATALLFSVPLDGQRSDTQLMLPAINAAITRDPEIFNSTMNILAPKFYDTLRLLGRVASDIHAQGVIHNQLHLGNVLRIETPTDPQLYVADWETCYIPSHIDAPLARATELSAAFKSYAVTAKAFGEIGLNNATRAQFLHEGLWRLLAGYRGMDVADAYRLIKSSPDLYERAFLTMYNGSDDPAEYESVAELFNT